MKHFVLTRWQQLCTCWLNASFRNRLVWGVTCLQLTLMLAVLGDLVWRQHLFLHEQGLEHAHGLAQTLAVSSASWVMAQDVAGLQEVVESVAHNPHVRYVMVLSPTGQVLAHSNREWLGMYTTDAVSTRLLQAPAQAQTLVHSHDLEDIAAPIMHQSLLLAWARVGIGQEQIRTNLVELALRSLLYIAVGALLAYLVARITANWLIDGLERLANGFERAGSGERGFRIDRLYNDEVGRLSQRFNDLLTDLESNEAQLLALATTDFLTGLANRRSFMEKMQHELARLQRAPEQGATILMLDLDHFKRVNDTYGHATGDAVLRHVAQLMRDNVRKIDLCGRLGGEEFAILLPYTHLNAAQNFAERLRAVVANTPTRLQGETIPITISIGLSTIEPTDALPDHALARADEALYRAKALGRNRVELYQTSST